MKTIVYFMDVSPLNDDILFERIYAEISPYRKRKVDFFKFRKDKNLSLGASYLLDLRLKEYGLNEKNMEYAITANGKPYFANMPHLHFNLSHAGDKVMVCFSDYEIGCDIEKVDTYNEGLEGYVLCDKELAALLQKKDADELAASFYTIWTKKESYIKATGRGLSEAINSFAVDIDSDTIIAKDSCCIRELESFAGYKSALCIKGVMKFDGMEIEQRKYRIENSIDYRKEE